MWGGRVGRKWWGAATRRFPMIQMTTEFQQHTGWVKGSSQ